MLSLIHISSHIQAFGMRFLSHVAGYDIQDRERHVDMRQEVNIMSIHSRNAQCQLKWLEYLNRMDDCRIPK